MRRMFTAALVLWLALAASCMSVELPRAGEPLRLEAGTALVFGKLRVLEGGRSIVPTPKFLDALLLPGDFPVVKLSLFGVESGKKALYPPYEDDGSFWWVVPRGTHLVFHTPPGESAYNEVLAAFQTPREGGLVYVGTLILHVDTRTGSDSGVEYTAQDVEVADEFDSARPALAQRHPDPGAEPVKALMFTDPELSGLLSQWSRRRCDDVLARHGVRALDR